MKIPRPDPDPQHCRQGDGTGSGGGGGKALAMGRRQDISFESETRVGGVGGKVRPAKVQIWSFVSPYSLMWFTVGNIWRFTEAGRTPDMVAPRNCLLCT